MDIVELKAELWAINNELVKAGIKPREYPTMHGAVAELVRRYKVAICNCDCTDGKHNLFCNFEIAKRNR